MSRCLFLSLLLSVLCACTAAEAPPAAPAEDESHKALRREIEKPLNRAHEAEAAAKAQAAASEQALKDATGE